MIFPILKGSIFKTWSPNNSSRGRYSRTTPILSRYGCRTISSHSCHPEIFSNLSNLEVLALCCNNLRELPTELFSGNPNLVEISLERNPISALDPGIFSGLSKLKSLDLHWLSLSEVPDSIYELTSLEELNMESNRISEVGEFTNLTELREIDLRHNRIDELPPRFLHGLQGIEKLFLSGNPGAPFAVPLILDRTDESDLSSSPASVAIKLHDTAIFDTMPFDLEVTVEAQRGDISESTITIPAEEQSSTEFTVTQESSEKATYVYVTSTGRLPLLISGLEFQSSAPLVLFVETSNQMPQGRRQNQTARANGESTIKSPSPSVLGLG